VIVKNHNPYKYTSRFTNSCSWITTQDGVIKNEMQYTEIEDIELGGPDNKYNVYEYGYSFMPPANWYPVPHRPPVCVSEKKCPVCPVFTTGAPVDAMNFDASRRITPPDRINTDYVEQKLNSGR